MLQKYLIVMMRYFARDIRQSPLICRDSQVEGCARIVFHVMLVSEKCNFLCMFLIINIHVYNYIFQILVNIYFGGSIHNTFTNSFYIFWNNVQCLIWLYAQKIFTNFSSWNKYGLRPIFWRLRQCISCVFLSWGKFQVDVISKSKVNLANENCVQAAHIFVYLCSTFRKFLGNLSIVLCIWIMT